MKVLYERVAGIDVHKEMVKVAIRSPGDKPWTRKTEILEFRTFYGVLQEMARELRRRGVTHVVMEASGVYTEPVYYAPAPRGAVLYRPRSGQGWEEIISGSNG
jgi:transposase